MKMREILFHGKRKDNGEWIEGTDVMCDKTFRKLWISNSGEDLVEVDPLTFGQYIGSTDKNECKVFEGDIVKFKDELFEVKYIEKYSRFAGVKPGVVFSVFLFSNSEVVGNIHDNPELIKGGVSNG